MRPLSVERRLQRPATIGLDAVGHAVFLETRIGICALWQTVLSAKGIEIGLGCRAVVGINNSDCAAAVACIRKVVSSFNGGRRQTNRPARRMPLHVYWQSRMERR